MVAGTATSLRRGLAILAALERGDDGTGLGVTQLAALIDSDKSQVSRTLQVLDEHGMVDRDPRSRTFRLGWRLYTLAARAGELRLLAEAPEVLRRLVAEVGERAHLSVLQGGEVLTLLSQSPQHAVQTAGWVGGTTPAHCTATGRALLMDAGRPDLGALLAGVDLTSGTAKAPHDLDALNARIVRDRSRGFAIADEELEAGLVAVAAPVRAATGRIIAAVNVSAPRFRFRERLQAAAPAVVEAAEALSRKLGAPPETTAATSAMRGRP